MADIAAHLGVSRQLVSLVLRELPGASDETRERVRRAAQELGYRPHIGARTLRQTRSRQIGVAFSPAHATEPDIVEAIYEAAADEGYSVILSAQTSTRTTRHVVEELLGYRCAALVTIGPELSDGELREIASRVTVPLVDVGAPAERNTAYDVVRSAGDVGTQQAVEHLIALRHQRIAFVNGPRLPAAAVRRRGYLRAMSASGLAADVVTVRGPDYTEECGATAARTLLTRAQLPTAVVAGNDEQALGVLHVLARAGVDVPGEVSLTGFDDTRIARLSSVDLTTARQDPGRMGGEAVAAALRRVEDPDLAPTLVEIEPTLVVRSSTGPPPPRPVVTSLLHPSR
jgi:DNA-binding LacI/PurR family transcriptional regulator